MTEVSKLQNNAQFIYKQNKNTPRMALCLNFSINLPEEIPGIYTLMARLLLQGTKKYNSEELANEFEKYAIDFSSELFPNYLRVKFVCLNEDFSKAIELMDDILKNSTFEEFEKEKIKLIGEITAELDSPRTVAMDAYYNKMFENHYYSNSLVRILDNIDKISKDDVINAFKYILNNSKKSLAVVGTLDKDKIFEQINETLGKLPISTASNFMISKPKLEKVKTAENTKPDLNQAHIIKGWLLPTYGEVDYPAIVLLNIILGSCGLSSRLFLELRDKKGLAYVVRSSYETFKYAGNFMIYIATAPTNIETCLKGFDEEIQKIRTYPVTDEELENAKTNIVGKYEFLEETNIQQACSYAKFDVLGLGYNYTENIKQQVQSVTADEILKCAQKYFTDDKYVLSIIKPE
ncbi:insulinase family protein [bacterium]|nr:insulinase family protein [bacterium]MBP3846284.1 insulinase family protein [bacterium]